jgi:hypothetical protein
MIILQKDLEDTTHMYIPIHNRGHKNELAEKQADGYNGRMNISGK